MRRLIYFVGVTFGDLGHQKSADWLKIFFSQLQIWVKKSLWNRKTTVGWFVEQRTAGCVADGHQGETRESLRLHGKVWNQPSWMGQCGGVKCPVIKNPWWDLDQYQHWDSPLKHAISRHRIIEILWKFLPRSSGNELHDPKVRDHFNPGPDGFFF